MKNIFKDKRNIVIFMIGAICIFTSLAGIAYAYISYSARQKEINIIETGCVRIEMEELTSAISLTSAYPMSDDAGANTKPFTFKVTNVCATNVNYNVNLQVMEVENRIAASNIATKLDNNAKSILSTNPMITPSSIDNFTAVEAYKLFTGVLNSGDSVTHSIRLWLDSSAGNDTQNGKFYSKVEIEAVQNQITNAYKETILNGTDPVLADGLVPVIIDGNGQVTKANVDNEWYSYEKKNWANAVILVDDSVEYNSYDVIPESNIESYFVWIPKYSYQLWDLGNYSAKDGVTDATRTINVKFGLENTNDSKTNECTTPMVSGESGNCVIGDYMTHPAFVSMGTTGLWVGKFETGYKGATATSLAQSDTNDSTKVQIKPNVYSWRGISAANAHLTSYNYKRELDSHMMKNTEWGAVAYLQHSVYGSQASVRFNNNSSYITGYASKTEPTCGYTSSNEECNKYESTGLGVDGANTINYLNQASVVASTTGNYSGIYDMSGGAWELVMAVMGSSDGSTIYSGDSATKNSGFSGINRDGTTTTGVELPSAKYYDKYVYGTLYTGHNRRILGDATGELGPFGDVTSLTQASQVSSWYGDEAWYILPGTPWFRRGNSITGGNGAGVFAYVYHHASKVNANSFRIVLAV